MAELDIDPEALRRLARLVQENGLSELRYEDGPLRITLRSAADGPGSESPLVRSTLPDDEEAPDGRVSPFPEEPSARPVRAGVRIEAPVMGVFYRAPSPQAPPYVEVGDVVEAGQPVGLIEAMKVFSDVLAEGAGRVREIAAKNGALVQPGETLLVLEAIE